MSETIDVAVLTPIPIEHLQMCGQLTDRRELNELPWSTEIGRIGRHRVGVFLCGKGQERTASAVALIAERFEPRWIFLTGVAGGIRWLHRGDVVIAEVVQALDYGKVEGGVFTRRPTFDWTADLTLYDRAVRLADDPKQSWTQQITEPRPDNAPPSKSHASYGYVGSSDKVVDDLSYDFIVDAMRTAPDIIAFEMEASGAGAGVSLARAFRNVGIMMIRGISDEPAESEEVEAGATQREEWKPFAAHVAAVFTRLVIEKIPRPSKAKAAPRRASTPRRRKSPPSISSALLPLRAPVWIFRRPLVDTIVKQVGEGRFPVVLQGLPDAGKTSMLAAAARLLAPEFEHVVAIRCDPGAALEPAYVAESLNAFLATLGRDLPHETLQLQTPADVFRQLVQRLIDLSLLVVIDDLQHLEKALRQELVSGLAQGAGVRIIATTDRTIDLPAQRIVIPPLEADEIERFIAEALRTYGVSVAAGEVVQRLPDEVYTQPAVLLPLLAQLNDVPLDLWPMHGAEPAHPLEGIVTELDASARKALAIVMPLAGVQIGRALRYLSLTGDDAVKNGLPVLVNRLLLYRRGEAYVVSAGVSAALCAVDPSLAARTLEDLVVAWRARASQRVRSDDDAYACGEVAAALSVASHKSGEWQLCRALASDDSLDRLNELGLWKEYTVVLRNGIDAAARDDRKDWVRLSCQLSRKLFELGEKQAARKVLDAAAHDLVEDTTEYAWVLSHQAMFRDEVDRDGAVDDVRRSIEIHHRLGNRIDEAAAWKFLANVHFRGGAMARARETYNVALALLPPHAARHRIDIASSLAMCDAADGNPSTARSALEETLQSADAAGYLGGRAQILLRLALVTEQLGDRAAAIDYATRAAAETFGNPRVIAAAAAVGRRMKLTGKLLKGDRA